MNNKGKDRKSDKKEEEEGGVPGASQSGPSKGTSSGIRSASSKSKNDMSDGIARKTAEIEGQKCASSACELEALIAKKIAQEKRGQKSETSSSPASPARTHDPPNATSSSATTGKREMSDPAARKIAMEGKKSARSACELEVLIAQKMADEKRERQSPREVANTPANNAKCAAIAKKTAEMAGPKSARSSTELEVITAKKIAESKRSSQPSNGTAPSASSRAEKEQTKASSQPTVDPKDTRAAKEASKASSFLQAPNEAGSSQGGINTRDPLARFAASEQHKASVEIATKKALQGYASNPNATSDPTQGYMDVALAKERAYSEGRDALAKKGIGYEVNSSMTIERSDDDKKQKGDTDPKSGADQDFPFFAPEDDLPEVSVPGATKVRGPDHDVSERILDDITDTFDDYTNSEDIERGAISETKKATGKGTDDEDQSLHLVEAELVEPDETREIFEAQEVKVEKLDKPLTSKIFWAGGLLALVVLVVLVVQFTVFGKGDKLPETEAPTNAPTFLPGSTWIQRGQDIFGEGARDASGSTIKLSNDGSILAVGAPGNRGTNGMFAGHVRLYVWDSLVSTWQQRGQDLDGFEAGTLTASEGALSLSDDGNTVAFGSHKINDDTGKTSVFWWDESQDKWTRRGSDIDGVNPDDEEGIAISLSGNGLVLALGARNKSDTTSMFGPGQVRVFHWDNETNDWVQRGDAISSRSEVERLGNSVAMSYDGSTIAIGAPLGGGSSFEEATGETRVYSWTGTAWSQVGDDIHGSSPRHNSLSLSADGTTVATAVMSPHGEYSGYVRVLTWDDATNKWSQKGESLYENEIDRFSISLSADGNRLAASEYDSELGEAKVHEWTNGSWELKGRRLVGNYEEEAFGHTVAISGDGNVLAVSAPNSGVVKGTEFLQTVGRVAVYEWPQDEES